MIFDTHAHYDDEQFDDDREACLMSLQEQGVGLIVNVSAALDSWAATQALTRKYPFIYGAVGVHPDEVGGLNEKNFLEMKQMLGDEKIVAVGETGLDYYWDTESREQQKKWFIRQLELAREQGLPVIIHSRDAAADTMSIMKEHAKGLSGVIHCFSYSPEQAREYVKMGFYIGIGGVLTFSNAKKLKEVAEAIPLEAVLLETDSPYLAPVPYRGKRNSSEKLVYVAEKLAELKGVSYEAVISQTEINARTLYRIEENGTEMIG